MKKVLNRQVRQERQESKPLFIQELGVLGVFGGSESYLFCKRL
jgi:hypothetical protein